ncbi:Protein MRPL-40 [Aphelenchoides avenae]|nr:Protein MRPL-40 [Aphelenchus avenae]
MNSLLRHLDSLSVRCFHTSPALSSSVFMKKQKKIDPDLAKIREMRKRRKLEREIRQMKKHSKKPKPIDEMTIDVKSAKNLDERIRMIAPVPPAVERERTAVIKEYCASRARMMAADDKWIRESLQAQARALEILKELSPTLYESAVQPDPTILPLVIKGPSITPPLQEYESPDGEYINTTRTYT